METSVFCLSEHRCGGGKSRLSRIKR